MFDEHESKEMTFIAWDESDDIKSRVLQWIQENLPECDFEKERLEVTVQITKRT